MAFSTMKNSNNMATHVMEYLADTELDVLNLPTQCAPGSTCIVAASGNIYIFNNQRQWVPFGTSSSSGGSVGGGGTTVVYQPPTWKPMV